MFIMSKEISIKKREKRSELCKNAFTLTEVLIALAIVGVLALILIPNMINLMPDDHAVKYRKAFYTLQEIIYDITQDPAICTGLVNDNAIVSLSPAGTVYTVTSTNANDPNNGKGNIIEPAVYLYSCKGNLRDVIVSKLSTVEQEPSGNNIQTTDGTRWNIEDTTFTDKFIKTSSYSTIVVSVDGKTPTTTSNSQNDKENGIYEIRLFASGKVIAPTTRGEQNYITSTGIK